MYYIKTNVPGDIRRLLAAERRRYVTVRRGVMLTASLREAQELARTLEINGIVPLRPELGQAA